MKTIYSREAGRRLAVASRFSASVSRDPGVRRFMVMTGRWSGGGPANHLITQPPVRDQSLHSNWSKLPQIFCQFFPNVWWWVNKTCTTHLSLSDSRYSWYLRTLTWAAWGCVSSSPRGLTGTDISAPSQNRGTDWQITGSNSSNHQNPSR